MTIVDMRINKDSVKYSTKSTDDNLDRYSREGEFYFVHLPFADSSDNIIQQEKILFTYLDKLEIIEFINFLIKANAYVRENKCEPEEVNGYYKWCDYSSPGLHSWPSKKEEYLKLTNIVVYYHDYLDNRYDVELLQL